MGWGDISAGCEGNEGKSHRVSQVRMLQYLERSCSGSVPKGWRHSREARVAGMGREEAGGRTWRTCCDIAKNMNFYSE